MLFRSTHGFIDVSINRGIGNYNIINLSLIKEFFTVFLDMYVVDIWYYWVLFILFCITSIIFAIKRNEIKKVLLPIFMEVSILSVIFSLVFCGKTFFSGGDGCFFLYHFNIIFLFKIIVLIPLYILFSYVIKCISCFIKSIKKKRLFNIIIGSILFISSCVILSLFFIYTTQDYIKDSQRKYRIYRQASYIVEKFLRFYYLQNELPVIPREVCISSGKLQKTLQIPGIFAVTDKKSIQR